MFISPGTTLASKQATHRAAATAAAALATSPPPSPHQWNSFTHPSSSLLRFCASVQSLKEAKQAHAVAILHGLHVETPICASLLTAYANCKDPTSSRLLFFKSPTQNVFLWNTLIRAHTNAGVPNQALLLYNQLARNGIKPDDHTYPFVLKACTDVSDLQKGKEVHCVVIKLGFCSDVFVGNTLLGLYSISMNVDDAQQVFDEMPQRDIVSWNSIVTAYSQNGCFIDAIFAFSKMKSIGFRPNTVSVVSILPVCTLIDDQETGKQIHGYLITSGLDSQVTVCNALVDMYGKCGNLEGAHLVFDRMPERNVVSWNAIMAGLAHNGLVREVLYMFREMMVEDIKPNSITISSLLPALVQLEFLSLGKEIHGYSVRTGAELDVFVANSLIDMYAKLGCPSKGHNLFDKLQSKNVVSWNAMIANFAQNGLEFEAIKLVRDMQGQGKTPNSLTFTNVLPACARVASLRHGKEIHVRSIRLGYCSDIFVSNAITDMYAKCGSLKLARNVFRISTRDEVSYNILILGYSQSWHSSEALQLFSEMGQQGLKHDTVSFMGALSACANLSAMKQGKEIHGFVIRKLFDSHLFVANSLLDLYIKCGYINLAKRIFEKMSKKDVTSWNAMILGYGMHGELECSMELFEKMNEEGVKYDYVSFLAVLSVCSHGGLVERGRKYFNQMLNLNIKPTQMHYACMVDLLGRAGLMEEAAEFIRDLPVEPDANVWGALLGASKVYGNIELGKWAAEHLFELRPEHCGYYILLANMYAEAGRWEEADNVRELMKSKGLKKDPGYSWIQISNRFHAFLVGDKFEEQETGLFIPEPV